MRTIYVFVCMPMGDRSEKEILSQFDRANSYCKNIFGPGKYEIMDSYLELSNIFSRRSLYCRFNSLRILMDADVLLVYPGSEKKWGCQVEIEEARRSGIPTIYMTKEEI